MRFVSDIKGLSITIRAGSPEVRDPATNQVTKEATPDLEATFSHDLLDDEAYNLLVLPRSQGGLANTDRRPDGSVPDSPFRGMQQDDSGKFIDIRARASVFDSEVAQLQNEWSDETREQVEQALLSHSNLGLMYLAVKPTPVGVPWNGYDSVETPDDVIRFASIGRFDLATILTYEKENQARPEFIDALEREIATTAVADVVVNA